MAAELPITGLTAAAYKIPTDAPEADGTLAWHATTLVVVEVEAGSGKGLGYTYADASLVPLIGKTIAGLVDGMDAAAPQSVWQAMQDGLRNLGRDGLAATAVSAVDAAVWDVKARALDLPLYRLLGTYRTEVPIYGSGGFTSYDDAKLRDQLGRWVTETGCGAVKMKIGTDPARDPHRMAVARAAIGTADLFIDANGAFARKPALAFAELATTFGVKWFEEPVSSDDLEGLREVRARAPAMMEIAAGEYGYDPDYFRRMLAAGAVDVLQADASRCGGITGFLKAAILAEAFQTDLSGHCAPALHLHAACAAPRLRHLEWFHDHVRIEHMLFDGAPRPRNGLLLPDPARPGSGLDFKRQDALRFKVA